MTEAAQPGLWVASAVPMLAISVLFQVVAAVVALLQVRGAGRFRIGWLALSVALLLMIQRRLGPLHEALEHGHPDPLDALIALLISGLLLVGLLAVGRLFHVIREHEQLLEERSTIDPLTGLANRRSLIESACEEIQSSRRTGRPLSLLMIDLDHFKRINDTLGHAHGDAVLIAVATALRGTLRAIDHVGRWGGEEFIVVLPESDGEAAVAAAERIRFAIGALRIFHEDRTAVTTVSIGVATLAGADGDPHRLFHTLTENADHALYDAKDDGRNCVREWHGTGVPATAG
jgi:diguanylate cyclase (GGDEF)-like protein